MSHAQLDTQLNQLHLSAIREQHAPSPTKQCRPIGHLRRIWLSWSCKSLTDGPITTACAASKKRNFHCARKWAILTLSAFRNSGVSNLEYMRSQIRAFCTWDVCGCGSADDSMLGVIHIHFNCRLTHFFWKPLLFGGRRIPFVARLA